MILRKKTTLLILIIIILVLILIIRSLPSEKKRLVNDILTLKKAVEKEEKQPVLEYIDPSYLDNNGLTYDGLVQIIDNMSMNLSSIEISMSRLSVNIDSFNESHHIFASCSLGMRIFATSDSQRVLVYGGVIQPSPVKGYFKKTNEKYRLYSADY